jgi:Cu(I)/Ag(I) efflux system membrane fusion protein
MPDNNSDMSDMGKAPVPGLVPVTIEPERLQLIGVRTAMAERRSLGGGIEILGYVTPDETRLKYINTRVSGWAQNLFVNQTGQYVESGKPLLSLYSQEQQR